MVYKVCKGGVRSGNTLRGLHTLRTRRYAGQACILGQSNLSHKQVDRLLEDSTEDAAVSDTLKNTNVLLSLNKRQRWRLPATVSHMIRSGQFSKSDALVSLLERHKLKKRANCVGFACSKQTLSNGQGVLASNELSEGIQGQKRYFSFNINSIENDESRRKWKKRMAELRIKFSQEKKKEKKDSRKDMKSVNVTTIDGGRLHSQAVKKPLSSNKPGYTLEVFYPCPQSCSLTFNPKYTDVVMTQNGEGEMEVRSNVKGEKKSQRKHRKKFISVDLLAINSEARCCDEDVEEMWREAFKDSDVNCDNYATSEPNDSHEAFEPYRTVYGRGENIHNNFSESILASLMDQAERARAQLSSVNGKTRHRRRSGLDRKSERDDDTDEDKAHIFHKERQDDKSKSRRKSGKAQKNKPASFDPKSYPTFSTASVVLSSSETSKESLKNRFSQFYFEANCRPRRFCINITNDVASLLSVYRSVEVSATYTTFIVFTSKGFYDEGLESYEVIVNSAPCHISEQIMDGLPREPTTLDGIVNSIVGNLLDLKEAGKLNLVNDFAPKPCKSRVTFDPLRELMLKKMNLAVDTFFTSEKITWDSQMRDSTEICSETDNAKKAFSQSLLDLAADSDMDIFCDICYESVNPSHLDAVSGTQLIECGHLFCDSCWRAHLQTRLRDGALHMTCPGYQCDVKLETSTLLSLLHVSDVIQLLRRNFEEEVESCPTAKWCPSPNCGRVIRLRTKPPLSEAFSSQSIPEATFNLDVTCSCGESWCFNCLSPAHWPARCEQAQDYLSKVSSIKPVNDSADDELEPVNVAATKPKKAEAMLLEVEGRLCPKCGKFIQKNGGCPHMGCKCGHQFCWGCMNSWNGHPSVCHPDAATLYKYSRRVKIHHMAAQPGFDTEDKEKKEEKPAPQKRSSHRQKATMYQRALQQRTGEIKDTSWIKLAEELTLKICKAAGKDLEFKRKVLRQCGVSESNIPQLPERNEQTLDCDLVRMPIADHVIRYLRSAREARKALGRVIEYTFVLLQDFPNSLNKRRALRVASDLSAFNSFFQSILEVGGNQDPRIALRRLSDIQVWSGRTLEALVVAAQHL